MNISGDQGLKIAEPYYIKGYEARETAWPYGRNA